MDNLIKESVFGIGFCDFVPKFGYCFIELTSFIHFYKYTNVILDLCLQPRT